MNTEYENEGNTFVGTKDVIDALKSGQPRPLEDVNNIESALDFIKRSEKQVKQYKDLKKKRVEAIDQEIETLNTRIEFFRNLVAETLKGHNQKTIKFPGLGKATLSKKKGKWIVSDDVEAIEALKKEDEYETCVQTQETINKKEFNKLLDVWEKVGKDIPESIYREPDADSVTITYEKETSDVNKIVAPGPSDTSTKVKKDVSQLSFVDSV